MQLYLQYKWVYKSVIDIKYPTLYVGEVNRHISNYKKNKIIKKWFSIKNKSMINIYVKSLNKHRRILAMARISHIKGIQRILNQNY